MEPDCILDKREFFLWNRTNGQVKVQWKHLIPYEETLELKSYMQEAYASMFQEDSE